MLTAKQGCVVLLTSSLAPARWTRLVSVTLSSATRRNQYDAPGALSFATTVSTHLHMGYYVQIWRRSYTPPAFGVPVCSNLVWISSRSLAQKPRFLSWAIMASCFLTLYSIDSLIDCTVLIYSAALLLLLLLSHANELLDNNFLSEYLRTARFNCVRFYRTLSWSAYLRNCPLKHTIINYYTQGDSDVIS